MLATAGASALVPQNLAAFAHVLAYGLWFGGNISVTVNGVLMFKCAPVCQLALPGLSSHPSASWHCQARHYDLQRTGCFMTHLQVVVKAMRPWHFHL